MNEATTGHTGMNRVTSRSESAERPAPGTAGLSFTGRIAGWSAAHRWMVLGASVLILVLAIFASSMFTPNLLDDFNGEGEAAKGADLVSERFDIASEPTERLLSATHRWTPTARYFAPRLKDLYSS